MDINEISILKNCFKDFSLEVKLKIKELLKNKVEANKNLAVVNLNNLFMTKIIGSVVVRKLLNGFSLYVSCLEVTKFGQKRAL